MTTRKKLIVDFATEEKSNIKLFEKIKDALLTIPGIDPDDFLMELMNINNEVESN